MGGHQSTGCTYAQRQFLGMNEYIYFFFHRVYIYIYTYLRIKPVYTIHARSARISSLPAKRRKWKKTRRFRGVKTLRRRRRRHRVPWETCPTTRLEVICVGLALYDCCTPRFPGRQLVSVRKRRIRYEKTKKKNEKKKQNTYKKKKTPLLFKEL